MQEVCLAIAVSLCIATRALSGSWLHPSSVLAAAWCAFLAIPTLLVRSLNPAPLAALLVIVITFSALLSSLVTVQASEVHPLAISGTVGVRNFVRIGAASGLLAGLITQRANGISLSGALTLDAVNAAARQVTVLRYSDQLRTPVLATLLLALTYGAAAAAPYAAAGMAGLRGAVMLVWPTLGGAFFALATTARAAALISASITAGSWIMVRSLRAGGRPQISPKVLVGGSAAGLAVFYLFVAAARARIGGSGGSSAQAVLLDRLATYAGGSLPAFDSWYRSGALHTGPRFGAQTFAGVFQVLLHDSRLGNAFGDYVSVGPGLSTNVYTILRPMTEDFGLAGAIFALAAGALFAATGFRRAVLGRSLGAAVAVGTWNGVVLFSMTTSILTFVNVVAGLVMGWLVLRRTVLLESAAGQRASSGMLLLPHQSRPFQTNSSLPGR